MNLDQAEIFLGSEALASFCGECWSGDGFDKELGNLFRGRCVDFAVDADDSTECGDRIAGQSFLVGIEDGCARCRSAGVGVLDDDHCRVISCAPGKLLRQLPAGVQIDKVVETEFLALELFCSCYAEAGPVGVESSALMRVFAVAERLGQREVDAQRCRQAFGVRRDRGLGHGSFRNLVQCVGDGGVVCGGERKGLAGQAPARFPAQGTGGAFNFLDEIWII